MTIAEPLRFHPICQPKVWGGSRLSGYLEQAQEAPSSTGPIGEVWQLVDRDETSSVVAGGRFDGRSLRGLMLSERESLLGESRSSAGGYFPLLVKRIDARSNLSVQVHPDAATAARLKAAEGKAEAWVILEADAGSHLYLGIRPEVDAKAFAEAATEADVVDFLETHEVRAGQCFYVPPGSVHSIGAGITLLEVQDNSDTTYRLFDWGRVGLDGEPRAVHSAEALKSIDYGLQPGGPIEPVFEELGVDSGVRRADLASAPTFRMEWLELGAPWASATAARAQILAPLAGDLELRTSEGQWPLPEGDCMLVPASLGSYELAPTRGEPSVIRVEALPEIAS